MHAGGTYVSEGLIMPIDWLNALNPGRTMHNLRVDITGDWFRDPWGWPEYDYVLDGHLDQLGARASDWYSSRREDRCSKRELRH